MGKSALLQARGWPTSQRLRDVVSESESEMHALVGEVELKGSCHNQSFVRLLL